MSVPGPSYTRISCRPSGQNPELGPLRVNPLRYPFRSASRISRRAETDDSKEEELSEQEQDPLSESEEEGDLADVEASPAHDPKGK